MNTPMSLAELQAAAEAGSAEHAFALALALAHAQRMDDAQHWHLRAAEAGHVEAQVEYARMRLYGIAVVRLRRRPRRSGCCVQNRRVIRWPAIRWCRSRWAAWRCRTMGRINERLHRAVQANFPPALLTAAIHFGRKAHPDDQSLCMQLWERAAGRGSAVAAMLLAERLAHGEGCERSPTSPEESAGAIHREWCSAATRLHAASAGG